MFSGIVLIILAQVLNRNDCKDARKQLCALDTQHSVCYESLQFQVG